jgi:hypothetical protein
MAEVQAINQSEKVIKDAPGLLSKLSPKKENVSNIF